MDVTCILQVRNINRSSGKVTVAQHAEVVGININITINGEHWYQLIVNLWKCKRTILPNEDLYCAISKSRTCCHNSFEDNLPSCYILETWITVYSLSISHEFWKSMTSTVTKIDSIFFNLFIFVFNVRFILFIFIKRSLSSPKLINFVLHLLCLHTLKSVFPVSILS